MTTTNDTFSVKAKINLIADEVELQLGAHPCILYQEKTQAIAIGEKVYINSEYPDKDQLFSSYFELISEGSISLLLKGGNTFYYKKAGQPAQKLKRTKKGLCSIFENGNKSLQDFINSNKINLKQDDDLIRVFHFLNNDSAFVQK